MGSAATAVVPAGVLDMQATAVTVLCWRAKNGGIMKFDGWQIPLGTIAFVVGAGAYFAHPANTSEAVAAWVQAVGSIGAILAAVWVSHKQYRDTRELEAQRAADDAAKNLAQTVAFVQAIREELRSIWFGYSSDARKRLLAVPDHEFLNYIYPVSADAFTIYNSMSSHVGQVPDAELRRLIVVVYAQAKGLVSSFQLNNTLVQEFHAIDSSPSASLHGMGSAIVKRRELISSVYKLKERDAAIERNLRAFRIRADKWVRSVGIESSGNGS